MNCLEKWALIGRCDDCRGNFAWISGEHGKAGRSHHAAEVADRSAVVNIEDLPGIRARRRKIRARCAWLDQRHLDAERRDLGNRALEETLDTPFGGGLRPIGGLGDRGGNLDDPPTTLVPQMRDRRTGDLYRTEQVRVELPLDLGITDLFRCAEQGLSGVADDDVDPLQFGEGSVDNVAHGCAIRDLQDGDPETVAVFRGKILKRIGPADRRRHAIAALKQKLCQLAPKAAAGACDEPCLRHRIILSLQLTGLPCGQSDEVVATLPTCIS